MTLATCEPNTPAVGMHLVDDHEFQVLEELRPLGMVREDALVQHVGIGDDDIPVRAHRLARIARRVAIEGVSTDAEVARLVEFQQFRHLILGQRLGGEKIESFGPLLQHRLDHRQVVAQRLAGGCRGDDDNMLAGRDAVPRLALMAVELPDAALDQTLGNARVKPIWKFRETRERVRES